jgi:hypothetical protein
MVLHRPVELAGVFGNFNRKAASEEAAEFVADVGQ